MDEFCEASAQLLQAAGPAGFTTNHVAARAGYSIGTLYRYFPDKQVLLGLLARREIARQQARVEAALAAAPPGLGVEGLVRIVIRAALHPFEGRDRLRQAMFALLPASWLGAAADAARATVLLMLAGAVQRHAGLTLGEAGHAALLNPPFTPPADPAAFGDPALEDAMVHHVAGCFAPA